MGIPEEACEPKEEGILEVDGDVEGFFFPFFINCIYKLESSGLLKRPPLPTLWRLCYGYTEMETRHVVSSS